MITDCKVYKTKSAPNFGTLSYLLLNLAGDEGFEPPNAGTKTRCLTTWRIPNRVHSAADCIAIRRGCSLTSDGSIVPDIPDLFYRFVAVCCFCLEGTYLAAKSPRGCHRVRLCAAASIFKRSAGEGCDIADLNCSLRTGYRLPPVIAMRHKGSARLVLIVLVSSYPNGVKDAATCNFAYLGIDCQLRLTPVQHFVFVFRTLLHLKDIFSCGAAKVQGVKVDRAAGPLDVLVFNLPRHSGHDPAILGK